MWVLLQHTLEKSEPKSFQQYTISYCTLNSATSFMLLSNAWWEILANRDLTLEQSHVELNGTKRPWCVGENIGREPGGWQRMLLERTRTRAEEERVKARWEQRRGWGGLGGGEEKEQRNRKADVEEVGNWWSRKLGYSCCESMCLCCLCVCDCAHARVCVRVWMAGFGSKWNCLSDQYGHHLPDDCGLYWRAIINHNQIWRTTIYTGYVCRSVCVCARAHCAQARTHICVFCVFVVTCLYVCMWVFVCVSERNVPSSFSWCSELRFETERLEDGDTRKTDHTLDKS